MAERTVYPRSTCCAPFCGRWSTRFPNEWLCAEHWKLVDRRLKIYRTKRLKQLHLAWAKANAGVESFSSIVVGDGEGWRLIKARRRALSRWHRTERLIWRRMKRQAIGRAAGI